MKTRFAYWWSTSPPCKRFHQCANFVFMSVLEHKAKHHKVRFVQKVLFAVESQDKPGVLSRLLNKMKLPAVVAGARVRSPSNFLACEGEQPV